MGKFVIVMFIGVLFLLLTILINKSQKSMYNNEIEKLKIRLSKGQIVNKNLTYLCLIRDDAERIEKYLVNQHISVVGIYGMGKVGIVLENYLEKTNIKICYGIDQNRNLKNDNIEIRTIDEISNDMDMIIVTAEYYYQDIQKNLCTLGNVPVVKLSNLLEEILMVPYPLKEMHDC